MELSLKSGRFCGSKGGPGKTDIDADAMKKAMFAMVKRAVNTDTKMTGKANKTPFRRRTKLGGAGRDEGLTAFFAQGDQGQDAQGDQKGKGKGKEDGGPVNNRGDRATIVGSWDTWRASAPAREKALRRESVSKRGFSAIRRASAGWKFYSTQKLGRENTD